VAEVRVGVSSAQDGLGCAHKGASRICLFLFSLPSPSLSFWFCPYLFLRKKVIFFPATQGREVEKGYLFLPFF
jgi:hypothetical protein